MLGAVMFACIHGRSVPKLPDKKDESKSSAFVDLAFTFSPLVEETTVDTVVLDISGQDLLFGPATNFAEVRTGAADMTSAINVAKEIACRAKKLNFKVNVAVAANPDVSIHAARSFNETTIIKVGDEGTCLGLISIKKIDFSLVGID